MSRMNADAPLVELRELRKTYGPLVAVDTVDLEIARGEFVVLLGPSGSGKTTILSMIGGFVEPTEGTVHIDGVDVTAVPPAQRPTVTVFQDYALFPHMNVAANVGFGLVMRKVGKTQREHRVAEALVMVGLEGLGARAIHQLSGGQRQRVALARAIAVEPTVLLLDEPLGALDLNLRRQMQDELMAIQSKLHKTILFITHDLNEALRLGNRVCILRDGKVIQIGTPEEILTEPADGYVAEFVQDVDQGRVIDVGKVMNQPVILDPTCTLTECVDVLGDRRGGFCCDADGRPTALLAMTDVATALAHGSTDLASVMRSDFDTTTAEARFNDNYAAAGRGFPIAVLDETGRLVGELEPREIMEEMGRVEQLVDGFEREVFL